MTVPYVCSACCRRTARNSVLTSKTQLARASSHALEGILSDTPSSVQPRQRPTYLRPPVRAQQETDPTSAAQEPNDAPDDFAAYIASTTTRTVGRYSRQPQPHHRYSGANPKPEPRRTGPPSRAYTSDLEDLLQRGQLSQAWSFFLEHYNDKDCPALAKPSFRDVAKVRSGAVFKMLLSQLTKAWQLNLGKSAEPAQLPTPSHVIKQFEQVGLASSATYSTTLWTVSVTLARAGDDGGLIPEQAYRAAVEDLMEIWSMCLRRQPSSANNAEEAETEGTALWDFVNTDLLLVHRSKDLGRHFDDLFALFVPSAHSSAQMRKGHFNFLAAAALITHDILTHGLPTMVQFPAAEASYMGFARSMDLLLPHTTFGNGHYQSFSLRLKDAGMSQSALRSLLLRIIARVGKPLQASPEKNEDTESREVDAPSQKIIKRVARAVERQDLDRLETLWSDAQNFLRSRSRGLSEDNPSLKIYEQFLIAFYRLRRPQSALQVWNSMVESGVQPTVRTWSVMMKGCHISRDAHIMETMWHRMRDSGIRPDVHAWTTRIAGLFKVGRNQDGLQALDEMGKEWLGAVRMSRGRAASAHDPKQMGLEAIDVSSMGNVDGVPKPDVTVLNATLSSLGSRDKHYIPRVLAWSRSFGIVPDVITYNVLLNVALTLGQQEEAAQILQRMAEAKVEPDSATFTIMINSLFHSSILQGLDHAQQEERVMQWIDALESNGVPIHVKGYALLVDRLMKEYRNLSAANKVLAHMASKNIEPTPHIYTILMTHYFDLDPPDLHAAEALWNQIQSGSNNYGQALDVIFYDRMVEGFARHGDVGRTMTFLTRMSKEGKRPGWLAMAAVVRCLAQNNEWDRLTQLVLDCHRQEGLLNVGLRGMKGQADFWHLVRELGVLDNLDLGPE